MFTATTLSQNVDQERDIDAALVVRDDDVAPGGRDRAPDVEREPGAEPRGVDGPHPPVADLAVPGTMPSLAAPPDPGQDAHAEPDLREESDRENGEERGDRAHPREGLAERRSGIVDRRFAAHPHLRSRSITANMMVQQ